MARRALSAAKAVNLVERGEIVEDPSARVFRAGPHKTMLSMVDGWSCTCEAGRNSVDCYHVKAAKMLVQGTPA